MSTMKSEEQSTTPTSQTPTTQTPVQSYTSWPSTQMAIDPALQQTAQHTTAASSYYQAYTSHYPQAAYATHYQAYAPPTPQAVTATQSTTQSVARPATTTSQYQTSTYNLSTTAITANAAAAAAATNGGMDTADIATLNDALGSAGVDLRAEEETLQRSHDNHQPYRAYEDRTRKQPPKPAFDTRILGTTMRNIGTQHKVTRIPEESVNYLALSLRARLQDLITAMIAASHHRMDTQFDRPASLYEEDNSPMWSIVVRSDVAKQLAALEKAEREEEMKVRKERKERAEMTAAHTAALAAQANGMAGAQGASGDTGDETEGNPKKKRKKDGPGVTARNMSEDVRKKMSNAVATQAAGLGGRYSWMNAANASNPAPKPKREATAAATTSTTTAAATSPAPGTSTTATTTSPAAGTAAAAAASSWARPYVSTKKPATTAKEAAAEEDMRTVVTMRDAMFVIEKERGHGGGRGAARGWV